MDGFCKPRCEDCFAFNSDPEDRSGRGFCQFNPPPHPHVKPGHWCGRWRNVYGEKFALWDVPEDVHKAAIDP